MLLKVENVTVYYDKVEAVRGVSIQLREGDFITILGANGAGKSTILRVISGLIKPASGQILFRGGRIDGTPAHSIVAKGIGHVPEGRRVFPYMSVYENLRMGGFTQKDGVQFGRDLDMVYELFPILKERSGQGAGTLSGGEQQMLAIGRSLMSNPAVLLMDEPSIGLSPAVTAAIVESLVELNRRGKSIVLVEQNAAIALKIARWGYVLETGRVTLEGPVDVLANDKLVREAYLGE